MTIDPIHLAITQEEADIILHALSSFQGIHKSINLTHPDDIRRQERSIEVARSMLETLEVKLLEIYHRERK